MEFDERFADRVADLCYKKYQSLPKKGKPQRNKEWTLLSCVCLTRKDFCINFFTKKMQMSHYILFIIATKLWPICMILSHLAMGRKELTVAWCNVSCYTIYQNNSAIYTVHITNVYGLSIYLYLVRLKFLLSYYVNIRGTNRNVW